MKYPCLQAADNLAFEVRKFATNQRHQRAERLSMTRLKNSGCLFRFYKLDYDGMKTIITAQDPDFATKPLMYTLADIIT